jgi:hypothetical protein
MRRNIKNKKSPNDAASGVTNKSIIMICGNNCACTISSAQTLLLRLYLPRLSPPSNVNFSYILEYKASFGVHAACEMPRDVEAQQV